MRVGLFFTFIILTTSLLGQSIFTQSIKLKSGTLNVASIKDTVKPDHLIFAFSDYSEDRWKFTSWAQELHWLATERNALIVSPEGRNKALTWADFEAVIAHFKDSVQSLNRTEFIALGNGAFSSAELIKHGYSGVLIAPANALLLNNSYTSACIAVIKTTESDSSKQVRDSLAQHGNWALFDQQFGADYYYLDGYKLVYSRLFERIDSVRNDIALDSLNSRKTIVVNKLPDVVRQGQTVELHVHVYQHGNYQLDLLNLSAKSVYHETLFLRKGKHIIQFTTGELDWGVYKVQLEGTTFLFKHKLMIRG